MKTILIFTIPNRLTSNTVFTAWSSLEKSPSEKETGQKIILDYSNLRYVDPEGLNYATLFPYYLSKLGSELLIRLPTYISLNTLGS